VNWFSQNRRDADLTNLRTALTAVKNDMKKSRSVHLRLCVAAEARRLELISP
jgi:hypothetical protein